MLSVILVGRNDSYGYNLHKRAAISLNCIAEVLTYPGDEIIVVDCNTQDDMPTFFEAIHDTLTPRAKSLLRILRLRPSLYEKYKRHSPLKVLEPLSRNIAVRRSDPQNRWILSTNTDMLFVVREEGKSLSDVVAEVPDGFYELPRFEAPQTLWESLNRMDPVDTLNKFRCWGQSLHLNEAVLARDDIRYDGPGDFQLMLRSQLFEIQGFDEEMVLGWHVDSNIARRLNLLNGKTDSLLDKIYGFHCEHTRQPSVIHTYQTTQNDSERFVFSVKTPYLPKQAEIWGIPHEELEEIKLRDDYIQVFSKALEDVLPGQQEPVTTDFFIPESYDHGQIYDTQHVLPFLADLLKNIAPDTNIGYYGANIELLNRLPGFLDNLDYQGHIYVNRDLLTYSLLRLAPSSSKQAMPLHERCEIAENDIVLKESDLFIFDASMMHFPQVVSSRGISFPEESKSSRGYKRKLESVFNECTRFEEEQFHTSGQLRKFLFIGSRATWFESLVIRCISSPLTPYCCHIQQGYIKPNVTIIQQNEKLIARLGLRYKKVILKVPLVRDIAKMIYRRLLKNMITSEQPVPRG
jgi:hypothetical protein